MERHIRLTPQICVVLSLIWFSLASAEPLWAAAPIPQNDNYSLEANFALELAAPGLLANDSFDPTSQRIVAYSALSDRGGSVLLNDDGSFRYEPLAGFVGQDQFSYLLESNDGVAQAVVTIEVVGPRTWFVDASAASGGDGSYSRPFNSFAPLNGASIASDADRAGDRIFVYPGTYNGTTLQLEANQQLIGSAEGLSAPLSGIVIAPTTGVYPLLTSGANVLSLADGVAVRGLALATSGTATYAVRGAALERAELSNLRLNGSGGGGLSLSDLSATSALTLSNSQVSGTFANAAPALNLLRVSGSLTVSNTPITVNGGRALNVSGSLAPFSNPNPQLFFDNASPLVQTAGSGLVIDLLGGTAELRFASVALTVTAAPAISVSQSNGGTTLRFPFGMNLAGGGYIGGSHTLDASGSSRIIAGNNIALDLGNTGLQQSLRFSEMSTGSNAPSALRLSSVFAADKLIMIDNADLRSNGANPTLEIISGFFERMVITGTLSRASGSGSILSVSGGHTGIVDLRTAVSASSGSGLRFNNADGAYNLFEPLSLSGGSAQIIMQNGSGGAITISDPSSSVASTSSSAVQISNSSGDLSYAGTITQASAGAYAIAIDGLQAGGSAQFGGTVTASEPARGVRFANSLGTITTANLQLGSNANRLTSVPLSIENNGAAISLGSVALYSNGATGLSLSGAAGGSIASSSGIVDSLGASALDLRPSSGTQSLALNLTTVNAANSDYGLRIAESSGSVRISGDGGANLTSGGTLSNHTIAGAELRNARNISLERMTFTNANTSSNPNCTSAGGFVCNGAIMVAGGQNLTLDRVRITGTTSDYALVGEAIGGLGLENLIVRNSQFENSGSAAERGAIGFQGGSNANLRGSFTLTNTTISAPAEDAIAIANASGSLSLNFSGNQLSAGTRLVCGGATCEGSLLRLELAGTASAALAIASNSFTAIDGSGLAISTGGASSLSGTLSENQIVPRTYSAGNNSASALTLDLQGASSDLSLSDNEFGDPNSATSGQRFAGAIGQMALGSAGGTHQLSLSGNLFRGSETAEGLVINGAASALGNPFSSSITINGNQIGDSALSGLRLNGSDPSGAASQIELVIQGNTIAAPRTNANGAIISAADAIGLCANIGGAGALSNTIAGNGTAALSSANGGAGSVFGLVGFAGDGSNSATVNAFLAGRNSLTGGASSTPPFGGC